MASANDFTSRVEFLGRGFERFIETRHPGLKVRFFVSTSVEDFCLLIGFILDWKERRGAFKIRFRRRIKTSSVIRFEDDIKEDLRASVIPLIDLCLKLSRTDWSSLEIEHLASCYSEL